MHLFGLWEETIENPLQTRGEHAKKAPVQIRTHDDLDWLWGLTAKVYKSLRTTAAIPQILDDCLFEITSKSKKNEWTPSYRFITKPSVKSWDCTGQLPGGNVCNLKWAAGQCFKKPADTAKLFPRDKWKRRPIHLKGIGAAYYCSVWRSSSAHPA